MRPLVGDRAHVADVFAGTGAVSEAFARQGLSVEASDQLPLSVVWCRARLLGSSAAFGRWSGRDDTPALARAVRELDAAPPIDGWITATYSPRSMYGFGVERRYFTVDNARRIDGMRLRLREWRDELSDVEHAVLMTSLLNAVIAVSNVAGTYGYFLREWKPSATRPIRVEPYSAPSLGDAHRVRAADAESAVVDVPDIVYADPPYTKRQYTAYYHVLNSIASDVEPLVSGKSGLPDWKPLASAWCYKRKAAGALESLVASSTAQVFALSYSSEGHIDDATIREILGSSGRVTRHEFRHRRYRSSDLGSSASHVTERLYVVNRA